MQINREGIKREQLINPVFTAFFRNSFNSWFKKKKIFKEFCRAAEVLIDLLFCVCFLQTQSHVTSEACELYFGHMVQVPSDDEPPTPLALMNTFVAICHHHTGLQCDACLMSRFCLWVLHEADRKKKALTNLNVPICAAICLTVGRSDISFFIASVVCDSLLSGSVHIFQTHPQEDWVDRFLQINTVLDCK